MSAPKDMMDGSVSEAPSDAITLSAQGLYSSVFTSVPVTSLYPFIQSAVDHRSFTSSSFHCSFPSIWHAPDACSSSVQSLFSSKYFRSDAGKTKVKVIIADTQASEHAHTRAARLNFPLLTDRLASNGSEVESIAERLKS